MAKLTLVPKASPTPSKMHEPALNTPCFCGTLEAFLEDPARGEIFCRGCGFRLDRATVLLGAKAMHASFVQFRAQVLEAGRQKADPMGLLPSHYKED